MYVKLTVYYDLIGDIAGGDSTVGTAAAASGSSLVPAIASGSGLIGGIIDAFTASSRQRKAQDFAVQQSNQQRQWALQDRDFANAYNAPAAQMARYKAAGLNPNLIYGANTVQSQPVRSTPMAEPRVAEPSLGKAIGSAASNYIGTQLQAGQLAIQAGQVGVLNNQASLIDAQRRKTEADIPLVMIETDLKKVQYTINQASAGAEIALRTGAVQMQDAQITKLLTDTQVEQMKALPSVNLMVAETIRAVAATQTEQARRILLLKEADLVEQNTQLRKLDVQFINASHNTLRPGVNPLWGIASQVLDKIFLGKGVGNAPLPKGADPQTGEVPTPRDPMDPSN